MFGLQRIGDLIWAAGDMRSRGFMIGGTAGRTTLADPEKSAREAWSRKLTGLMLSRWAFKPFSAVALPIILLLIAALFINSTATFTCVALGIFGWMRSGICFRHKSVAIRLAAEIGLGVGAGLAMSAVVLTATVSAALGVWLLFLIQTLYFVIFEYRQEPTNRLDVDPFDRARMAAEQILSH